MFMLLVFKIVLNKYYVVEVEKPTTVSCIGYPLSIDSSSVAQFVSAWYLYDSKSNRLCIDK